MDGHRLELRPARGRAGGPGAQRRRDLVAQRQRRRHLPVQRRRGGHFHDRPHRRLQPRCPCLQLFEPRYRIAPPVDLGGGRRSPGLDPGLRGRRPVPDAGPRGRRHIRPRRPRRHAVPDKLRPGHLAHRRHLGLRGRLHRPLLLQRPPGPHNRARQRHRGLPHHRLRLHQPHSGRGDGVVPYHRALANGQRRHRHRHHHRAPQRPRGAGHRPHDRGRLRDAGGRLLRHGPGGLAHRPHHGRYRRRVGRARSTRTPTARPAPSPAPPP